MTETTTLRQSPEHWTRRPPTGSRGRTCFRPFVHPDAFEPEDYGASTLRTTIFCLVFLLLLPFLPAFGHDRHARLRGLLGDNLGLLVLAAVFTALMFLVFVEMMFSIRTRVHLGREEKVRMTLRQAGVQRPCCATAAMSFPTTRSKVSKHAARSMAAPDAVLMKGARVNLKGRLDG